MAKQKLIIKDKERYQKYSDVGKSYFDGMMYAALEMIPKFNEEWHDMCFPFAEGFSFMATDTFLSEVDAKIDEKLKPFKSEIDAMLKDIKNSLSNLTTGDKPIA